MRVILNIDPFQYLLVCGRTGTKLRADGSTIYMLCLLFFNATKLLERKVGLIFICFLFIF